MIKMYEYIWQDMFSLSKPVSLDDFIYLVECRLVLLEEWKSTDKIVLDTRNIKNNSLRFITVDKDTAAEWDFKEVSDSCRSNIPCEYCDDRNCLEDK